MTTEPNQTNNEWGDAHLLALRNQMAEAGLHVETVGEGIAILLQAFNELNAWNKRICGEEN